MTKSLSIATINRRGDAWKFKAFLLLDALEAAEVGASPLGGCLR